MLRGGDKCRVEATNVQWRHRMHSGGDKCLVEATDVLVEQHGSDGCLVQCMYIIIMKCLAASCQWSTDQ